MESTDLDDPNVSGPRRSRAGSAGFWEYFWKRPSRRPMSTPDGQACTSGCNQKNNRDPVTNYTEEQVRDLLDELREGGLAAVVHTTEAARSGSATSCGSGTSSPKSSWPSSPSFCCVVASSPGAANPRQPDGPHRVPGRSALGPGGPAGPGFVQSNGPLDRRGVEVDHTFYLESENQKLEPGSLRSPEPADVSSPGAASRVTTCGSSMRPWPKR